MPGWGIDRRGPLARYTCMPPTGPRTTSRPFCPPPRVNGAIQCTRSSAYGTSPGLGGSRYLTRWGGCSRAAGRGALPAAAVSAKRTAVPASPSPTLPVTGQAPGKGHTKVGGVAWHSRSVLHLHVYHGARRCATHLSVSFDSGHLATLPASRVRPMPNRLQQLHAAGQSIWLDYIDRTMLHNGELARRIRERRAHRNDVEPDDLREGAGAGHRVRCAAQGCGRRRHGVGNVRARRDRRRAHRVRYFPPRIRRSKGTRRFRLDRSVSRFGARSGGDDRGGAAVCGRRWSGRT